MTAMLALLLWVLHGMPLWWSWGQFRPHIALLHGLLVALLAGGLIALGAPPWLVTGAAAVAALTRPSATRSGRRSPGSGAAGRQTP